MWHVCGGCLNFWFLHFHTCGQMHLTWSRMGLGGSSAWWPVDRSHFVRHRPECFTTGEWVSRALLCSPLSSVEGTAHPSAQGLQQAACATEPASCMQLCKQEHTFGHLEAACQVPEWSLMLAWDNLKSYSLFIELIKIPLQTCCSKVFAAFLCLWWVYVYSCLCLCECKRACATI